MPCLLCERDVDRDYCEDCFEGIREQCTTLKDQIEAVDTLWAGRLKRCVAVENTLLQAYSKGVHLSPEQCHELALKLGVPDEVRGAHVP